MRQHHVRPASTPTCDMEKEKKNQPNPPPKHYSHPHHFPPPTNPISFSLSSSPFRPYPHYFFPSSSTISASPTPSPSQTYNLSTPPPLNKHFIHPHPPFLMQKPSLLPSLGQCSEPSSPSVLEVGPDGPPVVVRLFSSPWMDQGRWR